jgi:single-strand selective monofunctional uracil DNA glycosylase
MGIRITIEIMIKSRRAQRLIALTREMVAGVGRLRFRPPVTHVYNPLTYAFAAYEEYLRRFA